MEGSPLKFSYDLGTQGRITTTVTGDNRDIAAIAIYNVNTQVYSVTLNSIEPDKTIEQEIVLGKLTIEAGAELSLTIPSNTQTGMVMFKCILQTGSGKPTKFSAQIAAWTLA